MAARHPERDQIRLEEVLSALGNPIRLNIARILGTQGERACGAVGTQLDTEMSKSTLTHHWRVLRDAGVIWQRPEGRENLLSLRWEDLNALYPGLLDSILGSAARQAAS
ncbi:DNA-binding transcriptional regulator, ArsR family [Saccharopolyspora antimicrobica]|uniref:DNA-binding transcriptional ArsR family regulator n=1 Tax=Saccharopolyspora antimicrobica TaxID=455193 RepID=A0A1I4Z574_9PSEU|nr:helix-turn-helix transcriptional regulator [Saccharopolyspora antimicrobica]RKT82932.1 DNA-binding transcriptional ArsR family regulator [Saccharopolyspora antimicrobica]SFN45431.1 DNA-binding transcriptional regulator, ArsR family [Saccharopolyspora antimicrobica]